VLIRFTSSLTPEDENAMAPALLRAISAILDALPIAYALRIETSDARIYQHSHPSRPTGPSAPAAGPTSQTYDVDG